MTSVETTRGMVSAMRHGGGGAGTVPERKRSVKAWKWGNAILPKKKTEKRTKLYSFNVLLTQGTNKNSRIGGL